MNLDWSLGNFALAFLAGLASVLSPCVLPVLPIVAAGSERDHKFRPLLITVGLSIAFISMGILSSLAGGWLANKMRVIEVAAGLLITTLGLFLLFGIDAFKRLSFLQQLSPKVGAGPLSGLLIGMALGFVWIPCIGPFLSSVLALVASNGHLSQGIALLSMYSFGLAIPILVAGYASRWFRARTQGIRKHALAVRLSSSFVLILFGLFIAIRGSYGLGAIAIFFSQSP